MTAIDNINRSMGANSVVIASQGMGDVPAHSDHRSPRYTTRWDEIPIIK